MKLLFQVLLWALKSCYIILCCTILLYSYTIIKYCIGQYIQQRVARDYIFIYLLKNDTFRNELKKKNNKCNWELLFSVTLEQPFFFFLTWVRQQTELLLILSAVTQLSNTITYKRESTFNINFPQSCGCRKRTPFWPVGFENSSGCVSHSMICISRVTKNRFQNPIARLQLPCTLPACLRHLSCVSHILAVTHTHTKHTKRATGQTCLNAVHESVVSHVTTCRPARPDLPG